MSALRWISVVLMVAVLVTWLLRTRGTRRSMGLGLMFLAILLQGVSGLFLDTVTEKALLLVSLPLTIWSGVLLVRETRALWRAEMERVKHL